MTELEISISPIAGASSVEPQAVTIRAQGEVLTRARRAGVAQEGEAALVPPERLAFWLTDNWWRLRWEPLAETGMTSDWRLAHEISAIGGGYAWPRIAIWGESGRIGILARSDPPGLVGPVQYLVDALHYVGAKAFEAEIDGFLSRVSDAASGFGADRRALRSNIEALASERNDPEVAQWRRFEALLGFDPDEAPDSTLMALGDLTSRYGEDGVQEAAAATRSVQAATVLEHGIEAARSSRIECDFDQALGLGGRTADYAATQISAEPGNLPWQLGESTARRIRAKAALSRGPVGNSMLADVLGVKKQVFENAQSNADLPYGLRLAVGGGRSKISLRSKRSHDRRFELVRALGDAMWVRSSKLGPLTQSRTTRQKFQRAFAQAFLCPYNDLLAYFGTEDPTDGDLFAAARHFHVSERVVRTVMVNKRAMDRGRLLPAARQERDDVALSELLEAS